MTLRTGGVIDLLDIDAALAGKADAVPTYIALLTQEGTSAPVATIKLNTLSGPIVWTRYDVGAYTGTLAGAFDPAKTIVINGGQTTDGVGFFVFAKVADSDTIQVNTSDAAAAGSDAELFNTSIIIYAYP